MQIDPDQKKYQHNKGNIPEDKKVNMVYPV
jgi:hypothetical protein